MKLKIYYIESKELQDYLDKYQDKIKFIILTESVKWGCGYDMYMLIIDEA